jgi:hypothetical protein
VVEDKGPPSRFPLACATLLHALWCAFMVFCVSVGLATRTPRSSLLTVVLWVLAVATPLYGFTIHRMWRQRRWAWRVCWIPTIAGLGTGLLALIGMLMDVRSVETPTLVLLILILVPAILLVPFQWTARTLLG